MKPGFFIGSAIALTLAACGPSQEETMTEDVDGSEIAADTTSPGAATAEAAVGDAQQFADNAAASDMYEIEAGKHAQKMGKTQALKPSRPPISRPPAGRTAASRLRRS